MSIKKQLDLNNELSKIFAAASNRYLLKEKDLESKFSAKEPRPKKENTIVINALTRLLLKFESTPSTKEILSKLLESERRFAPKLFYAAVKRVTKLKSNKAIFAVEFAKESNDSSSVSFSQYLKSLYWQPGQQIICQV